MKTTMFNILLFTTGAAIGSLVTWKIMKDRSERYIQEEIEFFKNDLKNYSDGNHPNAIRDNSDDCEEEDDEYSEADQVSMTTYHNLTNVYKTDGEEDRDEEVPYINGPYVISPDDFGNGDFDPQYLTYYADGVLADDWNVELDVDETIDEDSIKHFGEYQDDVLHVRNERLERDYEIVRDPRRYADVIA